MVVGLPWWLQEIPVNDRLMVKCAEDECCSAFEKGNSLYQQESFNYSVPKENGIKWVWKTNRGYNLASEPYPKSAFPRIYPILMDHHSAWWFNSIKAAMTMSDWRYQRIGSLCNANCS